MKEVQKLAIILTAALLASAPSFARTKKKASHQTTATHAKQSTKHRAAAHTSRSRKTVTSRSSRSRRTSRKRVVRRYQTAPTPERYKEIQQALADRGYYKGSIDGTWSPDCVDALRRFQAAENLDQDGKLGSLSLIALGLGPKRMVAVKAPVAAPAPVQPAPAGSARP